LQNAGQDLLRIDFINVLRGPSAPSGKWYLLFTVDGQSRGWFNHSVREGGSYPIGYVFRAGTGPSSTSAALQVAGFEDQDREPVVLPILRCALELRRGADGSGSQVAGCAGYEVGYTVIHDEAEATDHLRVSRDPSTIRTRSRRTRTSVAAALMGFGLYWAALISLAF
jgi:hypothetical protein